MDKTLEKKVVLTGEYEEILSLGDHYYIVSKKNKIAVLPYTISTNGVLDKLGVINDYNYILEQDFYTLINGYISSDDSTDLVCANRLLFEIIGANIKSALNWSYLGELFNNLTSDSPIKIYAVDISDVEIRDNEEVEEQEERKNFKLLDASRVLQTDESLLLSSYLRLFQHFYVNSLQKEK